MNRFPVGSRWAVQNFDDQEVVYVVVGYDTELGFVVTKSEHDQKECRWVPTVLEWIGESV